MPSDGSETIEFLVVDDEQIIRTLVCRALRSRGARNLLAAPNANEALKMMRKHKVQFVITDWVMPRMTGIELIRASREDPRLFATPFLVLTGISTAESVLCAMEEGADGYLVKPFSPAHLLKSIRLIQQRKADPLQTLITEMTRLKLNQAYDEAIAIGRQILAKKRDPNVLFMLGECLAKNKQYPDAIESLQESAQSEKCGKSTDLIGKIYMEQGEHGQAIDHLQRACEQCPLIQNRKVDLAEAYFKAGQDREAETVIDNLLRSNPTNLIMADLGRVYLEQGDLDKAKSLLKSTVVPTAENVHIFNNYAISLRRRKQYKESETIYRRCIELVPDSFALYFNAGIVYNKLKNHAKAKRMFEQALRLNPSYEPAKVFLETAARELEA